MPEDCAQLVLWSEFAASVDAGQSMGIGPNKTARTALPIDLMCPPGWLGRPWFAGQTLDYWVIYFLNCLARTSVGLCSAKTRSVVKLPPSPGDPRDASRQAEPSSQGGNRRATRPTGPRPPVPRVDEQRFAVVPLECPDLSTDGRLREVDLIRSGGEPARLHNRRWTNRRSSFPMEVWADRG